MSLNTRGSVARWAVVAFAIAHLLGAGPAAAGVTSSTQVNSYRVGGTTASGLISYMRNNPFHGDRGAAVANVRPSYSLAIVSKQTGGVCRASQVNLKVRFVMTLPSASNSGGMSPATRSAWSGFVAFARRHEGTHQSIYLQCANAFVAKAQRLTASSCLGLNASIRSLLEAQKRACDRRQIAFDRQDYHRVFGLSLFAMARSPGGKAVRVARAAPPRAQVIQISAPGSGLIGPR